MLSIACLKRNDKGHQSLWYKNSSTIKTTTTGPTTTLHTCSAIWFTTFFFLWWWSFRFSCLISLILWNSRWASLPFIFCSFGFGSLTTSQSDPTITSWNFTTERMWPFWWSVTFLGNFKNSKEVFTRLSCTLLWFWSEASFQQVLWE